MKKRNVLLVLAAAVGFSACEPAGQGHSGDGAFITSVEDIGPYLVGQPGGNSPEDPVALPLKIMLYNGNWEGILDAIASSGKYAALDLSACPKGTSSSGGGLYADGTFDPAYRFTNGAKGHIVSLTLPVEAASIKARDFDSSFAGFTALKSVSGAGVTAVGGSAFRDCNALASVSLPEAKTIGGSAFRDCNALASVSLPEAETIGGYAFQNCNALASVSLPEAETIGVSAFQNCNVLASVSLPEAETIDVSAFRDCNALASVSLPEAETIGVFAFSSCDILASVSLPEAETIGVSAFQNCNALASVTIGADCAMGNHPDNDRGASFKAYYEGTGNKAAGTYTYSGSAWSGPQEG
jgi:hypothetical protein